VPLKCTSPFKVTFREIHEFNFQKKLASFGGLNVQASKKKSTTKGKRIKIILQEIMELPEDV